MIFVPLDPEDASNFIKYIKGESAPWPRHHNCKGRRFWLSSDTKCS